MHALANTPLEGKNPIPARAKCVNVFDFYYFPLTFLAPCDNPKNSHGVHPLPRTCFTPSVVFLFDKHGEYIPYSTHAITLALPLKGHHEWR